MIFWFVRRDKLMKYISITFEYSYNIIDYDRETKQPIENLWQLLANLYLSKLNYNSRLNFRSMDIQMYVRISFTNKQLNFSFQTHN